MSQDRFDHLFIQPTSFDESLAFYRDTLGWKVSYSWGGNGEPKGAALSRMRANPSIERTPSSVLRTLPVAAHVQR